jgi:hypothetical protein
MRYSKSDEALHCSQKYEFLFYNSFFFEVITQIQYMSI